MGTEISKIQNAEIFVTVWKERADYILEGCWPHLD